MGRRTIVLVIAIVLAGVSAFAVWQYLSTVESDIRSDVSEVQVYRASESIPAKTAGEEAQPLIESALGLRENVVFEGSTILCAGPKPENEGQDPDTYGCPANPSDLNAAIQGKVAAGPISAGQVIATDQWVELATFEDASLSEELDQGKVAIGILPDAVAAAGGFVRPGDRVNLIASASIQLNSLLQVFSDPELRELVLGDGFAGDVETTTSVVVEDGEVVSVEEDPVAGYAQTLPASLDFTQTVLQDLEVLAVGSDTPTNRTGTGLEPVGAQIIVLEVTPDQSEQIEFAKLYTNIGLALLPSDVPYTPFDSDGVIVDDLFTLIDRIQAQVQDVVSGTGN